MPTKGPQPPRGPRHPTDADWKDAVRKQLAENTLRGVEPKNQKQLAEIIGCAPSAIAQMLGPDAKESSLKPAVHRALGWPPPSSGPPPGGLPVASTDVGEASMFWDEMTPEQLREALKKVPRDKLLAIMQLLPEGKFENLTREQLVAVDILLGPRKDR